MSKTTRIMTTGLRMGDSILRLEPVRLEPVRLDGMNVADGLVLDGHTRAKDCRPALKRSRSLPRAIPVVSLPSDRAGRAGRRNSTSTDGPKGGTTIARP